MECQKVISNSSPLINLSKVHQLDLIQQLYGQITVPQAVYDELFLKDMTKTGSHAINKLVDKNIISIREVSDRNLVKALHKDLDFGESEVIALALELKADLIIIDETDARKIAELYDLKKTGFIGLLIKAKEQGLITDIKPLLDSAVNKGFWINPKLYQKIIKSI